MYKKLTLVMSVAVVAACSQQGASSGDAVQMSTAGPTAETVNGTKIPQSLLESVAHQHNLHLDNPQQREQALASYISSVGRTRELPAEIVLSGHGVPITDHVPLIDSRLAATERRKEKIYGLIAERPRSAHAIAQAIWGNVAVTQAFLTLSEVIGHADLLVNEGRVREVEDGKVVRYETTG